MTRISELPPALNCSGARCKNRNLIWSTDENHGLEKPDVCIWYRFEMQEQGELFHLNLELISNQLNDEVVAIKKFKESDDDEAVRKTTMREVKILKMLKNENIVNLIEAFRRKGKLFLVFEYVERNMLEVLDESPNGLPPEAVRRYVYQLLKALLFCHTNGIMHRDIKPENLLVARDDTLKLCDFGFARNVIPRKNSIITGYVATRWYRGPELLLGSNTYGKPVDIWAVGCIMGELYTGKPVFPGESEIDQLYIIQKTCGPMTSEQQEMFNNNSNFAGLKFPDMSNPTTLERKYKGRIDPLTLSLMDSMLQMDSARRPSCQEALRHSYFDDIREESLDLSGKVKRPGSPSAEEATTSQTQAQAMMRIKTETPADFRRGKNTAAVLDLGPFSSRNRSQAPTALYSQRSRSNEGSRFPDVQEYETTTVIKPPPYALRTKATKDDIKRKVSQTVSVNSKPEYKEYSLPPHQFPKISAIKL
ncbi:Protein kinase domain containing protein [Planoprotostelium fungivorum]|uniref:Protein kinase domain containing protein n=1 Tax=Planoprotostelium fungivorum TaxID=1890364 RepID=A0A2P6NNF6_9EUKA|nr:Protein kinase domain containing protein [Planoprotostelium fungivorum]